MTTKPLPAPGRAGAGTAGPGTLGPGGLIWQLGGDVRNVLLLLHTGALQALHPAIGSALTDLSSAFSDPWKRLWRSSFDILGSVYDEDAAATGRRVRDYHHDVRGRTPSGADYHALSPGPFVWAHTTFVYSLVVASDAFGRPLTGAQKEQVWAEGLQWYARYGLGTRGLPPDWAAAEAYIVRVVEEELTHVTAGAAAVRSVSGRTATPFRWAPQPVWDRIGPPFGRLETWVAAALLPPVLRDRLCLAWTRWDAVRFAVFRRAVRVLAQALPRERRYLPRARDGWRRVSPGGR